MPGEADVTPASVEVDVRGDEGSRNGVQLRYKLEPRDEVWLQYHIAFDDDFDWARGGDSKFGVSLATGDPNLTGGGSFDPSSSVVRLLYSRNDDGIRLRGYFYLPRLAATRRPGLRPTTQRFSVTSRTRSSRSSTRFNGPSTGGDRQDPARPPDNLVGRYIGLAPALPRRLHRWSQQRRPPVRYSNGNEGTVTIHARVNTFSDETVTGPEGWPYEGRTVRRPNKDGLLEVFLDGQRVFQATSVVFVHPLAPDAQFSTIDVGGGAGGQFEGVDGTFTVSDVRYGERYAN